MDVRIRLSSFSKIFSSSIFVCVYFLFLDHIYFSSSLRIGNETIRPVIKISNISKSSWNETPNQLTHSSFKSSNEKRNDGGNNLNYMSLSSTNEQRYLENSKKKKKRATQDENSNTDTPPSFVGSRMQRAILSRQQKLGPIFYQEPPTTFYFSNDTGN